MSCRLTILTIVAAGLFPLAFAACEQGGSGKKATGDVAASEGPSNAEPPAAAAKDLNDQELIEKQKICPVTGEPLGSMGEPVKVVVKGRTVFLCCAACTKKLMADPDKYLKKLDEKE